MKRTRGKHQARENARKLTMFYFYFVKKFRAIKVVGGVLAEGSILFVKGLAHRLVKPDHQSLNRYFCDFFLSHE